MWKGRYSFLCGVPENNTHLCYSKTRVILSVTLPSQLKEEDVWLTDVGRDKTFSPSATQRIMIKWMINYTPLEWLLTASERCLREHDTNSDFWRLGTGALFMRSIGGKCADQCFRHMGARCAGGGAGLTAALTDLCGREGGRDRPEGEAFLDRVHFSHPFHWVFGCGHHVCTGRSTVVHICLVFP